NRKRNDRGACERAAALDPLAENEDVLAPYPAGEKRGDMEGCSIAHGGEIRPVRDRHVIGSLERRKYRYGIAVYDGKFGLGRKAADDRLHFFGRSGERWSPRQVDAAQCLLCNFGNPGGVGRDDLGGRGGSIPQSGGRLLGALQEEIGK